MRPLTSLHQTIALLLTTTSLTSAIETSSLFHLSSTAPLPISASDFQPNPPVSHVQSILWRSLASCPTTHYAVIVEPSTLSFTTSNDDAHIAPLPNVTSAYIAQNISGRVNVVHVINTILMDCLAHGVLEVKELDTKATELPVLDREVVRKSIIYARMQDVDRRMGRREYEGLVEGRREYIAEVVGRYFGGEDYTLVHMREEVVVVVDDEEREKEGVKYGGDDKAEIPLVAGHKYRLGRGIL